jgi:hypothetical protein
MENADLELDTKQANPYVAFESISGSIGIALLCRGGRFVGARLETALTNTSAANAVCGDSEELRSPR